ncbi:EH domain-containing protein [Skeletonema marinoi]|uniref:EH domain-containing protein n=1 Tax=Skeletonema marinoi TaxID=267567 RepID=A0AAD9DIS7_9STRA|nr:EH domain-containing protein [Skeletonema marinoi]
MPSSPQPTNPPQATSPAPPQSNSSPSPNSRRSPQNNMVHGRSNPTNNTLDKPKFAVAVRLIQLFQNGKKPVDLELNLSPEDGVVPMRPPFFEGVNLQQPQQQVQQPVPQQHSPQRSPQPSPPMQPMSSPMRPLTNSISMNGGMGGMSTPSTIGTAMSTNPNYNNNPPPPTTTALATQDPYTMTPTEQTRYTALFPTYATLEPNYVHGAQAVELFLKSGMDRNQLKAIWTMCDDDPVDNKLDVVEFAIAMHLIVCVTKKGLGLPMVLPGSLVRVRRESRMQQQQGQGQQYEQQQQQYEQQGIPTPTQNNMGGASVVGGMSTMQPPPPQQQQQQEGGIPSPEKMSGMGGQNMGMMQQQQGGGMTMMPSPEQQQPQMVQPPPPQMVQQQPPQMVQQQPQMSMQQQPGMMQQQQPEQQQMGMENGHAGGFSNGFGSSGALGGETVDDAFAGLPNDPIPDVDAYSAIGGPAPAEQQPTIPALPLAAAPSPVLQSMAPPSSSPIWHQFKRHSSATTTCSNFHAISKITQT